MIQTVIRNILLGLALAAPIGPAGIAVIRNGLNHGFFRAFLTGVGITLVKSFGSGFMAALKKQGARVTTVTQPQPVSANALTTGEMKDFIGN